MRQIPGLTTIRRIFCLQILILLTAPAFGENVIKTIAGNGQIGFTGDGGLATAATLNYPTAVAVDRFGNIYIGDSGNSVIRKIDANGIRSIAGYFPTADIAIDAGGNVFIADPVHHVILELTSTDIFIVAGNLGAGFAGDGGPAISASLNAPKGIAFDNAGNLFIADTGNNRIRMVDSDGIITTVAGNGTPGFRGDGGPANQAGLLNPNDVAVDRYGDLFIADAGSNRIRRVDSTGTITTVAGGGATDQDDLPARSVFLQGPSSIAFDTSGALYVVDGHSRVRRIDTAGIIHAFAGTWPVPEATGDNGPATAARLSGPSGIAFDTTGNLYIADTNAQRIRRVSPDGGQPVITSISVSSGTRGATLSATIIGLNFNEATAVSFSGTGVTARIGSGRNSTTLPVVISIASDAALGPRTFTVLNASQSSAPFSSFTVTGIRPVITGMTRTTGIQGTGGTGVVTGTSLTGAVAVNFSGEGVTAEIAGLPTDTTIPVIIRIESNAVIGSRTLSVTTPADISDPFSGFTVVAASGTGSVIGTFAGTGNAGFSGDGGSALVASLNNTRNIVIDRNGTFFVLDNNRVRKITRNGLITTVAGDGVNGIHGDGGPAISAGFNGDPTGLAIDTNGNIFISDANRIHKVDASGTITTVAGGGQATPAAGASATSVRFSDILDIAADNTGNLLIAVFNGYVWKMDSSGTLSIVAGNGTTGFSGDGGPATAAQLMPSQIALDTAGDLFIAETFGQRIRKVNPAGIISTFAGTGTMGFSGDGGPAVSAQIRDPHSLAVDRFGNVYIIGDYRIRKVNTAGVITTIAGDGQSGSGGDGGLAASARFFAGFAAIDNSGNVFLTGDNRIREVLVNPVPSPVISSMAPSSATQGTSGPATVSGSSLNNVLALAFSGTGVTGAAGNATTDNLLPFTLSVLPSAPNGARSVRLATPHTVSEAFSGFTVTSNGIPSVTSISPGSGVQGTIGSVQLTGSNLTGTIAVTFSGTGLTGTVAAGSSDTRLNVDVAISSSASIGPRTVTVTTSTGSNQAGSFVILPSTPVLTSINPASGSQGATFAATITGSSLTDVRSIVFSGNGISASIASGRNDTTLPIIVTIAPDATNGIRTLTAGTADTISAPLQFNVIVNRLLG